MRRRTSRQTLPDSDWEWDETLYAGSARYYARGRLPYPQEVAGALRDELGLDGTGRLLDIGCGPGSLALLLAPLFEEVVGVDADAAMVAEAEREAAREGVANATWVQLRAEDLPADQGTFRVAAFAQSFHWMDRERVAQAVRLMLEPGGVLVHVHATTHQGVGSGEGLPAPQPPRDEITDLVAAYLGPVRRAGRRTLPAGTPSGEDEIVRAAGFGGPGSSRSAAAASSSDRRTTSSPRSTRSPRQLPISSASVSATSRPT